LLIFCYFLFLWIFFIIFYIQFYVFPSINGNVWTPYTPHLDTKKKHFKLKKIKISKIFTCQNLTHPGLINSHRNLFFFWQKLKKNGTLRKNTTKCIFQLFFTWPLAIKYQRKIVTNLSRIFTIFIFLRMHIE